MSQPNLNREWIFEHEEAFTLLHPGDAVGLDGTQTRDTMSGTVAGSIAFAGLGDERRNDYAEGYCVPIVP